MASSEGRIRFALSEEQMGFVEPQMATIGYMLANYKKFGDDALEVARDYFYELGKSMGQSFKERMGVTESDANAVARVMGVVLEQVGGMKSGAGSKLKVEGNKVIAINTGFCPIMESVRIMNAPWETVCRNYSWRWLEGLAAGVNPDVTMEVPESRIYGKDRCCHVITVP
jgi:hypothetical protein